MLDSTDYCALSIIFCFSLASSQGQSLCAESCLTPVHLTAQQDSEVLLPCAFTSDLFGQPTSSKNVTVVWTQTQLEDQVRIRGKDLVHIEQSGRVSFSDPRKGRVKVFPNLSNVGNFSIRIDQFQESDQGQYCCQMPAGSKCSRVMMRNDSSGVKNREVSFLSDNWLFFAVGGVSFVFFLIPCVCWAKFRRKDDTHDYVNETINEEKPSENAECDQGDARVREEDSGNSAGEIIYENDEHDPNNISCVVNEHSFQKEITHCRRVQQENTRRPYYANQSEIAKQAEAMKKNHNQRSFWRKKPKDLRLQYENPIYANSTEQLDHI